MRRLLAVATVLAFAAPAAVAGTVTVITSFPKELTAASRGLSELAGHSRLAGLRKNGLCSQSM